MKKNAFTLIELLAVIVILAIIALIAVPIVVNIINDSKKSAEKEGINLYIDMIEKMITKKQLSDSSFNPDRCEIQTNGDLKCYKDDKNLGIIEVEMKGEKPNDGIILIENNTIKGINIKLNELYYQVKAGEISNGETTPKYAILIQDLSPKGLSEGDKYTYKVNDKDTFNFYVLSIETDKVNLIMDRNLCDNGVPATQDNLCTYRWNGSAENREGPVPIMRSLYSGTKDWDNVPNMNLIYNDIEDSLSTGYTGSTDTGYTGMNIIDGVCEIIRKDGVTKTTIELTDNKPLKARLPKLVELYNVGCNKENSLCPTWLMEYILFPTHPGEDEKNYESLPHIAGIHGYWTLASYPARGDLANFVYYSGRYGANGCWMYEEYGMRPVITVPIEYLDD